ncbi:dynein regulatory complex protein 10 isoform X1 [Larimichthys crocea]|uniref:dynein regulatory complex protein 10 isoform X1 n=2 Tax=Larimichthys crocea TaxID=215358 RepID=UPI000F5F69A8|nr:dynein regulatory complex protein 9 isoform X1 [Larimichthys crocea]
MPHENAARMSQHVHELPQEQHLSPEAKRISNVLKNCIRHVEIAAILPALLQLNSASGIADEELSRALQKHQILEDKMLESLEQDSDRHQEGNFKKRAQLERDFKDSVKDVLRVYRNRPDIIDGLMAELDMKVGETENMLIGNLKTFHGHVVERMLLSVEEERLQEKEEEEAISVARELEDIVSQEEKITADLKGLDKVIAQEDLKIKDLQSKIEALKTKDKNRNLLHEKQCQAIIKASKEKQASVQKEMDKMTIQLKEMRIEHREAERVLQKRNARVREEIELVIQHFDNKMEELQAKLELNQTIYEKEQEEVRRMEPYFSALETEYNEILEKRRLAEEKRKEEMRVLELKTKAAIFAQAWWRGYSTRKALKNKKNKNKGGKRKKAK